MATAISFTLIFIACELHGLHHRIIEERLIEMFDDYTKKIPNIAREAVTQSIKNARPTRSMADLKEEVKILNSSLFVKLSKARQRGDIYECRRIQKEIDQKFRKKKEETHGD